MSEKTLHDYRIVKTFINDQHARTEYFFSNGMIYKTSTTRRAVWKREDTSVSEYVRDPSAGDALAKLLKISRCLSESEVHKRPGAARSEGREVVREAGSRVADVKRYGRDEYVFFKCPKHDNARYKSRDPWISPWIMQDVVSKPCPGQCQVPLDDMVLTAAYTEKES